MAAPDRVEKRTYVRAELDTRVKVQPVSREELEAQSSTLPAGASVSPTISGLEPQDGVMALLLQRLSSIEEKLDTLLQQAARGEDGNASTEICYGIAQDVSGAGLKLTLDEQFKVGQSVLVSLSVPGFSIGSLDAYGEIVRVHPMEMAGQRVFETSLKFLSINENEREKLIAYSFQRQRQVIRNLAKVQKKDQELS